MALFTPETAAIAIRKRWDTERERKSFAAIEPEPTDDFVTECLNRVRGLLRKTYILLDQTDDAQERERLARSASALEEQERRFSGRFIPGQLKPSSGRSRQAPANPQPTISSVPPEPGQPT